MTYTLLATLRARYTAELSAPGLDLCLVAGEPTRADRVNGIAGAPVAVVAGCCYGGSQQVDEGED